ncbi:flavodoxin domain-containing protein [Cellulomonas sp. RIT-PI-Y]|uniref:flavodoxin domain-containing protein n=1 Tax=Cellulomonas sp. RIT-PI-Y TaxID=3035297 RepID=UPI0021DA2F31|nr:flavodoxin domain-containing protein [Cellulomonas sp. RIT-PI-Y]
MRILVTTASRHGGTREIGEAVADVLAAAGHAVDRIPPEDVLAVDRYDAVVLGSAVYAGRLAVSLRDLVERQGGQLAARPVWLFWSGPVGHGGRVTGEAATPPDDVDAVARRIDAREVACFGGQLRSAELGLAERALVAMIDAEDGDHRDFDAVEEWARGVAVSLRGAPPRPAAP